MAARRNQSEAKGSSSRLAWVLLASFAFLLLVSLGLRHGDALSPLLSRDEGPRRGSAGGLAGGGPAPAVTATQPSAPAVDPAERLLSLQILNATGLNDLALEKGEALRDAWRVDVLDRANAPAWPFPETLLIQRGTRHAAVAELARRLGGVPVILQRRDDLALDATLVLGHDWRDYRWPEARE
jgi:hypothetical protein